MISNVRSPIGRAVGDGHRRSSRTRRPLDRRRDTSIASLSLVRVRAGELLERSSARARPSGDAPPRAEQPARRRRPRSRSSACAPRPLFVSPTKTASRLGHERGATTGSRRTSRGGPTRRRRRRARRRSRGRRRRRPASPWHARASAARCRAGAAPKRRRSADVRDEPARRAPRARVVGRRRVGARCRRTSGSPNDVASSPSGREDALARAPPRRSPRAACAREPAGEPVAGVRVRPRLLDADEPAHRRQLARPRASASSPSPKRARSPISQSKPLVCESRCRTRTSAGQTPVAVVEVEQPQARASP